MNLSVPLDDDIALLFIVNPPIIPDPVAVMFVAVRSPFMAALDADRLPAASTWNALFAPNANDPVLIKNPALPSVDVSFV